MRAHAHTLAACCLSSHTTPHLMSKTPPPRPLDGMRETRAMSPSNVVRSSCTGVKVKRGRARDATAHRTTLPACGRAARALAYCTCASQAALSNHRQPVQYSISTVGSPGSGGSGGERSAALPPLPPVAHRRPTPPARGLVAAAHPDPGSPRVPWRSTGRPESRADGERVPCGGTATKAAEMTGSTAQTAARVTGSMARPPPSLAPMLPTILTAVATSRWAWAWRMREARW
jgi:hypothetical protein